jgi:hypothetical protein
MKYNSSKFFPVFKAGGYPQGDVPVDFINEVAANYNEDFKKSPLTIDHQDGKSYAWVKALKVEDDTLLASFDEVTDEAVHLTQTGNYRYPSVEFKEYERDGKKIKYLRAITLTNFNEVKNLPQLKFTEGVQIFKTNDLMLTFVQLKDLIKSFSEKFDIKLSEYDSEAEFLKSVEAKFSEFKNIITKLETENITLKNSNPFNGVKFNEIKEELETMKKLRIDDLLENAAKDGKIAPIDKENYRAFVEYNFDLARKMFNEMPVKEILKPKQIASQFPEMVELTNPKFVKPNGVLYRYEEVIKDSSLLKRFSDDELAELKKQSETFK